MRINHNISALRASNYLGKTNTALEKSLEKLSSGYRINRAADDAAGMAISRKMKTQIAALDQAERNAADGISVIQTAEGALTEIQAMAQRMRELAVQASNGTNTETDNQAIQNEIDQLNEEIQRISDTTEFNTKPLLNGTLDRKKYTNVESVEFLNVSDKVKPGEYSITIDRDPAKAVLEADNTVTTDTIEAGTITINGVDVVVQADDTHEEVFNKLRTACEENNIKVTAVDDSGKEVPFGKDTKLHFESSDTGKREQIHIVGSAQTLTDMGLTNASLSAVGADTSVTLGAGFSSTATAIVSGNEVTITDTNGFEMKVKIGEDSISKSDSGTVVMTLLDVGPMSLQIGANKNQTLEVNIPEVNPKTLGIENINVISAKGAQEAITKLDDAISKVSEIRAKLGAYQNRLEYSISNLETASLNMDEALSRIEDTDMAKEMTKYTQQNILNQAGTSMLAQANERPQTILSLLQG